LLESGLLEESEGREESHEEGRWKERRPEVTKNFQKSKRGVARLHALKSRKRDEVHFPHGQSRDARRGRQVSKGESGGGKPAASGGLNPHNFVWRDGEWVCTKCDGSGGRGAPKSCSGKGGCLMALIATTHLLPRLI
jgi:hypothetical protein